ncbi:MAG: hypothetical protein EA395_09440 [Phormidium sp. GEM2.Bin31]|nr:MAG: hypothetical protein EA395_09440 [Phormidium sp. GEM2.Bin31]
MRSPEDTEEDVGANGRSPSPGDRLLPFAFCLLPLAPCLLPSSPLTLASSVRENSAVEVGCGHVSAP